MAVGDHGLIGTPAPKLVTLECELDSTGATCQLNLDPGLLAQAIKKRANHAMMTPVEPGVRP